MKADITHDMYNRKSSLKVEVGYLMGGTIFTNWTKCVEMKVALSHDKRHTLVAVKFSQYSKSFIFV